jgi:uncharacterized PurR-regulated membrane protein YhhQ (DUF165 family)
MDVVRVGINNYIYKFVLAIALTPLLYLAHHWIDTYLGKKQSDQLLKQASVNH